MSDRVAVVTGGNRGIGYALVKALCRQFDGAVYLTARNTDRGKAAVDELKKHGLNPKFHLLDISDHASVVTFKNHLKEKYRGLDLLISNAAISYPKDSTTPVSEQAEAYIKVNNFGASDLCAELFPLLRPNARVLIVSSGFGQLKNLKEKVRPKFNTDDMTVARLNEVLSEYVQSAKAGKLEEDGWPAWPNVVSKVGLHALARILARQISKDIFPGILVNAVCPGWTVTEATTSYLDKNGYFGDEKAKTPEEAVVDLLYVALLPSGTEEPQGKLVKYRKFLPYDE